MLTREASLAWNSKGRSEVEQHSLLEPEGLLRRVKSIGTQPPKVPMVLVGIWKSRMEGWATQTDRHQEERLFIKCLCRHVIPTNAPVLLCSCPLCLFSFLFPICIFFFFTSLLTGLIRGHRTALLISSLCPSLLPEGCFRSFGSICLCFSFHSTFRQNFLHHVPTCPSVYISAFPSSTILTQQ